MKNQKGVFAMQYFTKHRFLLLLLLITNSLLLTSNTIQSKELAEPKTAQQLYQELIIERDEARFSELADQILSKHKDSIFCDFVALKCVKNMQKKAEHEKAFSYLKARLPLFKSQSLYSVALLRLIRISKHLKKYEEAILLCEDNSLPAEVRNMLIGDIYLAMDNKKKAISFWKKAINNDCDKQLKVYLKAKISNQISLSNKDYHEEK